MDKKALYQRIGSMQQLAYIRSLTYQEGRCAGLRALEVKNGRLSYRILTDKCMDMGEFSYGGVNFNFLSKPGLQGRNHYDTHGDEALRSIMGGLFFTAGLENICAPCNCGGRDYPMHGRIRTTPAEHVFSDAVWDNGNYVLRAGGEMREAELFGENMVLRRSIETVYGSRTVTITDHIENESYRPEPLMLLYHINIGYPLLDEGTELLLPTRSVTPRDAESTGHEGQWSKMDAPKENEPEYVFIHQPVADQDGNVIVCVLNEKLGLGLRLCYTGRNLPRFMQWKSTAAGDYVLGLEPSNSSVYGRPYHESRGDLHYLAPFAAETNVLTFTVLDGKAEMQKAREEIKAIL